MSTAVSIDTRAPVLDGALDSQAGSVRRGRWWVELLAIGWLLWVYDAISNLAPMRLSLALGHARAILGFEQSLGIASERTLDHWLALRPSLGLAISDYYDNAHFIVTLGLLAWLWWRRADLYRPLRNSLVLLNVIAFAVFWLYPVAPPRMLAGFTDVVAATHAVGSWHTGSLASHANELAAMPSLHMAWAGWCSVALWRITTRASVRGLAILYPCLTALAVLATGNHFVLDILAGLATVALALALAPLARAARGWAAGGAARARRRATNPA